MKNEKVTADDLKATMAQKGISSENKRDKIIQRLQVNGSLIALVSDVLDSLINDELGIMRLLDVQYKQELKVHKNEMLAAAKKFHYHMGNLTKSFFGDESIRVKLEDNAQDYYEIIKLLADHTNSHKDMEVIKKNLRKRKLNHHIFE